MSARDPLHQEWLTPAEVVALTGTTKVPEQDRVLTEDGIPHKLRGRRILVSRFHTREWLAGRPIAPSRGVNLALVK